MDSLQIQLKTLQNLFLTTFTPDDITDHDKVVLLTSGFQSLMAEIELLDGESPWFEDDRRGILNDAHDFLEKLNETTASTKE